MHYNLPQDTTSLDIAGIARNFSHALFSSAHRCNGRNRFPQSNQVYVKPTLPRAWLCPQLVRFNLTCTWLSDSNGSMAAFLCFCSHFSFTLVFYRHMLLFTSIYLLNLLLGWWICKRFARTRSRARGELHGCYSVPNHLLRSRYVCSCKQYWSTICCTYYKFFSILLLYSTCSSICQ